MNSKKEQAIVIFGKFLAITLKNFDEVPKKYFPSNMIAVAEFSSIIHQQAKQSAMLYCDGMHAERRRAVDIAYQFKKKATESFESRKNAGGALGEIAFVKEEVAEECRYVGNAISGQNALTMNNKEYWEQVKDEIEAL